MNDQPKPSFDDDCTMPSAAPQRRVPVGPRAPWTWPVELEAEPWRPS
jgi:hypothetical protein